MGTAENALGITESLGRIDALFSSPAFSELREISRVVIWWFF